MWPSFLPPSALLVLLAATTVAVPATIPPPSPSSPPSSSTSSGPLLHATATVLGSTLVVYGGGRVAGKDVAATDTFLAAPLSALNPQAQDPSAHIIPAVGSIPRSEHASWMWNGTLFTLGGDAQGPATLSSIRLVGIDDGASVAASTVSAWKTIPGLTSLWKGHTAVLMGDTVWVHGGQLPSADPTKKVRGPLSSSLFALNLPNTTFNGNFPPSPRAWYGNTATASSGLIVHIGGEEEGASKEETWSDMTVVMVYDPVVGAWSARPCSGDIPIGRKGHVAIAQGNKIIIIGGVSRVSGEERVLSDVVVLDTQTWVWTRPSIPSPLGARWGGVGTMIGSSQLLLAHGSSTPPSVLFAEGAAQVPGQAVGTTIVDTSGWVWAPVAAPDTASPLDVFTGTWLGADRRIGVWIGILVGLIALILGTLLLLWHLRKKRTATHKIEEQRKKLNFFDIQFIERRLRSLRFSGGSQEAKV